MSEIMHLVIGNALVYSFQRYCSIKLYSTCMPTFVAFQIKFSGSYATPNVENQFITTDIQHSWRRRVLKG